MTSINNINTKSSILTYLKNSKNEIEKKSSKGDSVEISNTAKVYDKVDKFFNLGAEDRLDISDLSKEEKDEFLKMIAKLIDKGVVGYEVLEVNKKPEKHYVDIQIGDERIKGAKLYKKKDIIKPRT